MIIGFGVVGQSVAKMLSTRADELVRLYGIRPRLIAVADRGGIAFDSRGLDPQILLTAKATHGTVAAYPGANSPYPSTYELISEADADAVIEVTPTNIGSGEPGLTHIMAALKSGKHVITANKGPLALAFPALMELAQFNGVMLRFSGTVGGGTPILDFAKNCLRGDRIIAVKGILNGTTNYILSKMTEEGIPFEKALREAQSSGYAEADPTLDVDGFDAACKLVIIANWVMGVRVTLKDASVRGIREISLEEVLEASRRGMALKLLATMERHGELRVSPQPILKTDPLCVSGALNAVTYISEYAGYETIIGKGAGGVETASAIVRDIINIKQQIAEK